MAVHFPKSPRPVKVGDTAPPDRVVHAQGTPPGGEVLRTGEQFVPSVGAGAADAVASGVTAARTGDRAGLATYLKAGGDPNAFDSEGWNPLLAAASRGQTSAVRMLLEAGARLDVRRPWPGLDLSNPNAARIAPLPIHYAAQAGSLETLELIAAADPKQLGERMLLNGHDVAMQLVFYHGANPQLLRDFVSMAQRVDPGFQLDHAVTTARGLTHKQMAAQFNNFELARQLQAMEDAAYPWPPGQARLEGQPFQNSPALEQARGASYRDLLAAVAPAGAPSAARQRLDALVSGIETRLRDVTPQNAQASIDALRRQLDTIVKADGAAALNQLAGPLSQPPLVVAVTGGDGADANAAARANLRKAIVEVLVRAGADPMVEERHPMAVDAFIRALVFNHLDEVRIMASSPAMTADRLAQALNRQPRVNGLTGVHDTVLRTTTATAAQLPTYLNQLQWVVEHGARVDLPDFSGRTQRAIAEQARDNPDATPQVRANGAAVVALLDALTGQADAYTKASARPPPLAPEVRSTLRLS